MSDEPQTNLVEAEMRSTSINRTLLSSEQREPVLVRAMDAPPAAATGFTSPVMEVQHTRIGGNSGVRVQHMGGVTTKVKAGADVLDMSSMRVSHAALGAVAKALNEETTFEALRAAVAAALASAFQQL